MVPLRPEFKYPRIKLKLTSVRDKTLKSSVVLDLLIMSFVRTYTYLSPLFIYHHDFPSLDNICFILIASIPDICTLLNLGRLIKMIGFI